MKVVKVTREAALLICPHCGCAFSLLLKIVPKGCASVPPCPNKACLSQPTRTFETPTLRFPGLVNAWRCTADACEQVDEVTLFVPCLVAFLGFLALHSVVLGVLGFLLAALFFIRRFLSSATTTWDIIVVRCSLLLMVAAYLTGVVILGFGGISLMALALIGRHLLPLGS